MWNLNNRNENLEKVWKIKLNLNAKDLRRSELLEKYTVKILFGWNYHKVDYSLICDVWTLGVLLEV